MVINKNKLLENAQRNFAERNAIKGPIEIPELGESPEAPAKVHFKEMNIAQRDWVLKVTQENGPLHGLCALLIKSLCNENGKLIFDKDDLQTMATKWDPDMIERVSGTMRAARLAGLGVDEMGESSPTATTEPQSTLDSGLPSD